MNIVGYLILPGIAFILVPFAVIKTRNRPQTLPEANVQHAYNESHSPQLIDQLIDNLPLHTSIHNPKL